MTELDFGNIMNILIDIAESKDESKLKEALDIVNNMHEEMDYICSEEWFNNEILKVYREKQRNDLKNDDMYK